MVVLLVALRAHAGSAEAAALGGLDPWPRGLDTTTYFDTDLRVYENPALADRYRDRVAIDLGLGGGGPFEGAGIAPRALGLFTLGPALTGGFALNRRTSAFGEGAAIGPTIDALIDGEAVPGELGGGTFRDPVAEAGLAPGGGTVAVQAPLDLFLAVDMPAGTIGANLYAAFGERHAFVEDQTDPVNDLWVATNDIGRSSWVSATVGYAGVPEEDLVPEAWLRYTGVSAWSDAQAFGEASRDGWTESDVDDDHTVGLRGTHRIGVGARATIVGEQLDIVPALQFDTASGGTFADFRLYDDTLDLVEGPIASAESDEIRVSTHFVRAGVGLTYRPVEGMRVVGTASVAYLAQNALFDDHADVDEVPGTFHDRVESGGAVLVLPLVSIGAEHFPDERFGVRGALRTTALWHRTTGSAYTSSGAEVDGFSLGDTSLFEVGTDGGQAPVLNVALGPAVRLEHVTLDAVVGGFVLGSGGDLFSRLDLTFDW